MEQGGGRCLELRRSELEQERETAGLAVREVPQHNDHDKKANDGSNQSRDEASPHEGRDASRLSIHAG